MMQQYLQIKERYRDAILFFRLGDFYEMFFEDAQTASKILDIALTSRNKNEDAAVPLCGVPYHSAEPYIQKLLDAGHKVAVCEQMEDPKAAKGVVQREVVRVITPGTVTAAEALDARGNNFLASVWKGDGGFGLAVTDITTGEFRFTRVAEQQSVLDEISRIKPSELLVSDRDRRLREGLQKEFPSVHLTAVDEASFSDRSANRIPGDHGVDVGGWEDGIRAASAIIAYLEANAPESRAAGQLPRGPQRFSARDFGPNFDAHGGPAASTVAALSAARREGNQRAPRRRPGAGGAFSTPAGTRAWTERDPGSRKARG